MKTEGPRSVPSGSAGRTAASPSEAKVTEDKRNNARHRIMKPATIGFAGAGIECLVCNISSSGAAIEIKGAVGIPESFNLTIASEQVDRDCRVVWRKYQRIGVAFV